MASWARHNLTLGTSISTSTCDKVRGLDVTLDNPAGFADGSWWMIGCRCVIHEWSELRLGPLVPWGQWEWLRSNTKRRKHIENHRPRSSDPSESDRIATKRATHLRALGLQPTNRTSNQTSKAENNCFGDAENDWLNEHENEYNHLQHQTRSGTSGSSGSGVRGLEPAGGLEPIKEAWWSGGWCRKINSEAIPDNIC